MNSNPWKPVWIALGSNLNDPKQQLLSACKRLQAAQWTQEFQCSSLYQSIPVGPQDQPNFINAVARFNTHLGPEPLLDALQQIEQEHHRVKTRHWGERTLDLDILLFDDKIINTDKLRVPHPEMLNRDFVFYPLLELSPNVRLPSGDLLNQIQRRPKNRLQLV